MSIRRVLVAGRGEIALRVFRTCERLGIETVAVASPDDRGALHAREAGTTLEVPSYLDSGALVEAARSAGADAVHPGYGFLAENAALAAAVAEAGIIWVGPPATVLERGGDKLAAKRAAEAAGIPLPPTGDPEEVGFPLIVKAAAGGGGRGMRVVRAPDQLAAAIEAASREAEAGFGDPTIFCERYLERPRHIEVQLLADAHGTVHALGERDCSVQRRHQKVLEESPAPGLEPALRARLADYAIRFAQEIGYVNAGTAEFLVDDGEAWFLELNGRLQVEHPVTEAVTGLDLVELQLRVADGESLAGLRIVSNGHAVEARLYAEEPRSFLPRTGTIETLRLPGNVRIDAGVAIGDEVGTQYDPLLAKLVAHGASRLEALEHLATALAETEIGGVVTNLAFLRWLVAHPAFRAGDLSTAFLTDHPPLSPTRRPFAPVWKDPWRLNLPRAAAQAPPEIEESAGTAGGISGSGVVVAPMPGTVLTVAVEPGELVESRQQLVVLEAMKLEHSVTAPFAATVRAVRAVPGGAVTAGDVLVELERT